MTKESTLTALELVPTTLKLKQECIPAQKPLLTRDQRLCKHCKVLENEFHFIIQYQH